VNQGHRESGDEGKLILRFTTTREKLTTLVKPALEATNLLWNGME
jgi:hypothetical protein